MRRRRVLGDPRWKDGHYYHVISRVIEKRFIFGTPEKEYFYKLVEAFCDMTGIELITWTCLSNHFHLLLRVPHAKERENLSDMEILERLRFVIANKKVYSGLRGKGRRDLFLSMRLGEIRQMLERLKRQDPEGAYQAYRNKLLERMYDLPAFMRDLKQRFSQWYNRRQNRKGPLWEERYKSVLLEQRRDLIMLVAAYIDLNPVRAGIVKDPKDYRWSGYAEALAKDGRCRKGLRRMLAMGRQNEKEEDWKACETRYRNYFHHYDRERNGHKTTTENQLNFSASLGCRIRHFTEGLAMGSAAFIENVFEKEKGRQGWKRKRGARQSQLASLKTWHTMVDLRKGFA